MNPITYPFKVWGTVLSLAALVGVGVGLYHVAGDIFRERENARELRAANARVDTLVARLDTAIAHGDSLMALAVEQAVRASEAELLAALARYQADSAKAKAKQLAAQLQADTNARNPDGYIRFTIGDSLPFYAPPVLLTILNARDSAFATLDHALGVTTLALGESRAAATRWQATAERYRTGLDTALALVAAQDSVIALHVKQRPSRLKRLWEKIDAPLAFAAGIYAATR